MGVLAGLMILMFYSTVAGWALDYVWQSASGSYAGLKPEAIEENFNTLASNPSRQLIWYSIFIALTGIVVPAGVTRGTFRPVYPK